MRLDAKEKRRLRDNYGDWALVTGATSGMGLAIARLLADAGFNLVICSRHHPDLKLLAASILESNQIQVLAVAADLSTEAGLAELLQATAPLTIELAVLSAGYGTSGLFAGSEIDTEVNMVRLNCEAVLRITHAYISRFAAKNRGGIILFSSLVAFQGVPFASNYAATKAYVQTLAEGLYHEVKPYGVDILAAAPGPVQSGFGMRAGMQMNMFLTPEDIAAPVLKALGRKPVVLPGKLTKILVYALQTVPRWAKVRIMKQIMRGMTRHSN